MSDAATTPSASQKRTRIDGTVEIPATGPDYTVTATAGDFTMEAANLDGTDPEPSPWSDTELRTLPDGSIEFDVTTDGETLRYTSTDEGDTWSDGVAVADE